MNKKALSIFATLAFILTAGAITGHAQDVKADIPFAFTVANKVLPAGHYSFTQLSQSSWAIRNSDGSGNALTIASADHTSPLDVQGKVVFQEYGDKYFLREISRNGLTMAVPRSRLQRELARNNATPTQVSIAASQ